MNRLDRYILRQLAGAFGFFVLVFTGVVWLTPAASDSMNRALPDARRAAAPTP